MSFYFYASILNEMMKMLLTRTPLGPGLPSGPAKP